MLEELNKQSMELNVYLPEFLLAFENDDYQLFVTHKQNECESTKLVTHDFYYSLPKYCGGLCGK